VKSGKFDATWWLPRLKDAIELNPQLTHTQMIGNEIKAAASIDSRGALDVLRLLLKESEDIRFDSYDLVRNAVPFVLAQAISSGDIGLKDEALALMNQLGERGHLGLESEVNEMLKGEGAAAAEP
jgi:hypothetical protein